MRKSFCATVLAFMVFTVLPALAQNPNYDWGLVWRVNYFRIKPGQEDAFWKDFRENLKPSFDALKREGILVDYKLWTSTTRDNSENWDVALALLFANWAGLDKADASASTIMAKHYGSKEAMAEAARRRSEIREMVAVKLMHEVIPK